MKIAFLYSSPDANISTVWPKIFANSLIAVFFLRLASIAPSETIIAAAIREIAANTAVLIKDPDSCSSYRITNPSGGRSARLPGSMNSDSELIIMLRTPQPSGGGDLEESGGSGAIDLNSYSKTPSELVNFETEKCVVLPFARVADRASPYNGIPVSLAVAFTVPLITL